ncbi:tail fiber domain-containing protein [Roseivirga sp.]|uniref:tail fiber domain-containing protein n=1 Tax=Roseivirga sp. TaxID=1964215 RepID=UPI003B8CF989
MKKRILFLLSLTLCFASLPFSVTAFQGDATESPSTRKMNFQGTLYENGVPVTGERSFTFQIDLGEGNSWTETQASVQVIEGLYSVVLGSVTPIPDNIFFDANERELTVSIGNTVLGTTTLYAPFALNDNQNFGYGDFRLEAVNKEDSVALNVEIYGKGTGPVNMGLKALAATDSVNTGAAGIAYGNEMNPSFQTGVRGNAFSNNAAAWATGVWGVGYGDGAGVTYGVRGEARGTGNGFSAAMRGLNLVTPGENGLRYGGFFNTFSLEGSPFTGESIGVRGNGVGSINNTGVIGEGAGEGSLNIGVRGMATGAEVNWAGWFDGNVALKGGGNLQIFDAENNVKVDLNYYEPNNSGSLVTYGNNNSRMALIGSTSDFTGGLISLYDSTNVSRVQLRSTSRPGEWPADKSPHGQMSLLGPKTPNIYMGARVWEEDGADAAVFQMFGKPVADPNNEGNTYGPEGIYMTVEDLGDEKQQGVVQLNKEGENPARLTYDNLTDLLNFSENGKFRFDVNEQNSGSLKVLSSVDSVNVLIDSNGEKAGLIQLNDSLGRKNLLLTSNPQGGAYLEMSAGVPAGEETEAGVSTTYQLAGGQLNPWTNLISRNADGTTRGRILTGAVIASKPAVTITGEDFRALAQLGAEPTNGGELILEGPTTSNFWLGQKNWENSDLPFMAMRGATQLQDDAGNSYSPDGLILEVSRYDDGSDNGVINFYNINNGISQGVSLDYYSVQNLLNPQDIALNGPSGNQIAAFRRRGGGDFGMAEFLNNNNELRAEIGSFGDNSGFMQLYGPNNNKNIQMGGSDSNRDLGLFRMSGSTNNDLINMEVGKDDAATEYGFLNVTNNSGGGYEIGSRVWENDNQGGNRSYTALKGTVDLTDENANNYRPWLVAQQVQEDGNGGEFGEINLSATAGGYVNIFGHGGADFSGDINANAFNQNSDARLKKNVETLTNGLATINRLRGVSYNWKDDSKPANKIGFIAQEVEKVLPELVITKENGFKAVNYAEMTAVLVEAVKELSKEISDLKRENSVLKAEATKVNALEDRLSKIEAMLINSSAKVNANDK